MTYESIRKIQVGSTFDFLAYITKFNEFYRRNFNKLVSFWKNPHNVIESSIIIEFNELYSEFNVMQDAFEKRIRGSSYDLDFFEFAEYIAGIELSLDIIKNLPKYLKTSSNDVDVFEEPVITYLIKQGDTLESISKKFYGDPEKFELIMDYNEIRYTEVNAAGWIGRKILIPARGTIYRDVDGIIDGLIGEKVLGKDIKAVFAFAGDDVETVEYENCLVQSVMNMVTECEKGSVPEYPHIGTITKKIIGRGFGGMSLAFLANDFNALFKMDPTIEFFTLTNIELRDDALFVDFSFKAITGYEAKDVLPVKM